MNAERSPHDSRDLRASSGQVGVPRGATARLSSSALNRATGHRIRELRRAAGLTRSALGWPVFDRSAVAAIELGQRAPSISALAYFAQRLELPLHDLVWEIGPDGRVAADRTTVFHHNDPAAPRPNHTEIGVVALVEHRGRLLLELRADCAEWGLLGGGLRLGESFEQALRREVREEAGLELGAVALFGVASDPTMVARYRSGSIARVVTLVCRCRARRAGPLTLSSESTALRWFARDELRTLDLVAPHAPFVAAYAAGRQGPLLQ
ncbi:MAG: NUDIX domain-containing protein [Chloroflexi bacterium]|nr:NUDIX domain-containing protein [Chloroflexota bacterium]